MKVLKFFSLVMMFALTNFALISCGSDDDGESGGGDSGAPYAGVWKATYMEIEEDGEKLGGKVPNGYVMTLTLKEDGTYTYYTYTPAEDGDEAEEYNEVGEWYYNEETCKLYCEMVSEGDVFESYTLGVTDVLTWTPSKLVTKFVENDEYGRYSQTTTWSR